MTGAVTIDGWTQPGYAGGAPIVEFPGTLGVAAADSAVRGLRLKQLATTSAADRLALRGSILAHELGLEGVTDARDRRHRPGEGNQLAALTLYAGSTGATIRGNEFTGTVLVQSTASATIGGTTDAARNRLAGGPLARVDVLGSATIRATGSASARRAGRPRRPRTTASMSNRARRCRSAAAFPARQCDRRIRRGSRGAGDRHHPG